MDSEIGSVVSLLHPVPAPSRARRRSFPCLVVAAAWLMSSALWATEARWPSFRGPGASGIGDGKPPTTWDVETGKNVAWKTAVPGLGLSSPVIWGDRLFITTAVSEKDDAELKVGLYGDIAPADDGGAQSWRLYCLDRHTGEILWFRVAHEGKPKSQRHTKGSHAGSTAATDGRHVVAHFGSEGLFAWDMDGKLLWKKDFGKLVASFFRFPEAEWGYATSPLIHGDKLLVLHDVVGESYLAAFEVATGKELWRTRREDVPTWGTPTVVETEGRTQVVVNGYEHMGGYDLATGKELWRMSGGGDIPVPTPVFADGLIYLASAHGPAAPVLAVRPDAVGDISLKDGASSGQFVSWMQERVGVYLQTPLVYGGEVFASRDSGALHVFDAKTGELRYKDRIATGNGFTASPVAADGKVYFTAETGEVHVLKAGAGELTTLAVNALGELTMATPAIVDGTLYVRSRRHVFALRDGIEPPAPKGEADQGEADQGEADQGSEAVKPEAKAAG